MIAGVLEVQMLANMARLQSDMDSAKRSVSSAMGNIEKDVARAKAALGALGIGLSAGYFVSLIKGSIDAADHLNDLSKSTNIAAGDLAGLRLLARQSGTDLDGLAKAINKMSVEMGKDPEKFKALGITAKDNVGALKQFADIFNQLPDINQRNALAQAVFSKSWAELAPVLAEGGQKIGETIEKGKRLSGITADMTREADAFNDKWVELTGTGGLLTRQVAPLLPLLNALADDMLTAQEQSVGLTDDFHPLAEAFRAVVILGGNVSFVMKAIGTEAGGLAAQMAALARGDFAAFTAIGDMMKQDAAAARAAFDVWEQKMLAVGTTAAAAVPAVKALTEAEKAAQKAAAARAAEFLETQKKQKEAYEALQKKAADYIKTLEKETAQLGLTAGQKKLVEAATVAGTLKTEAERQAVMRAAQAWVQKTEALEQATAAARENNRVVDMALDEEERERLAVESGIKSLREKIEALDEETFSLTATSAQMREHIILLELQKSGLDKASSAYAEMDARLRAAMSANQMAKEAKAGADAYRKAWDDFARDLESSLTDALMRSFESGDSFGEAFAKNLKNLFKTMILKAAVQITVGTVAGAASQVTGLNFGGSGGSGGSGDAMSLLSNGSSIYNAFGGISSGYAGFATSGVGSALGLGSATAAGYSAPVFASALEGGALISAGTGTAAGGMTAAGASIGAAIPYVAAAIAVASILGVFDKKKPAPVEWGYADTGAQYAAEGNMYGVPQQGPFGGSLTFGQHLSRNGLSPEQLMDSVSKPLVALDKVLAEYLTDDEISKVATALQARKPVEHGWNSGEIDAVMMERLGVISDTLGGWVDQIGDTVTGSLQERYTAIAQLLAMRDNELIAQMGEDLLALGDGVSEFQKSGEQLFQTLLRLASTTAVVNPVLERIGVAAFDIGLTGASAASTLVDLAGGIDAFAAKTGAYYMEFFTEEERRAATLGDLADAFGELDLVLPTSRDGFRDMVEGLDLTTEAGRETFNILMDLSPAFAAVTQVADAAGNSALAAMNAWWGASAAIEKAQSAASANASIMGAVAQNTRDVTSAMRGFIASFVDFRAELLGSDLSPAGGLGQNAALLDQLRSASALAAKGDKDAMGDLPGIIRSYLASSQNLAVDQEDYMTAFSRSSAALDLATAGAEYKIDRTQRGMIKANAAISGNPLPASFYSQPPIPKSAVETNAVLAEIIGLRADTQASNRRLDRIERHVEHTARGVNGQGDAPMLVQTE